MRKEYQDKMVDKMTARFADLEDRIMQDIVRRINMAGKITSTADWQINRLKILGYSSEDIEASLKETLNATYPEMFELYDKVINWEYVRNKDVYEQINAEYIPYNENEQLKQITEGIKRQTKDELDNITQSLGFYLDYGDGRRVLTPLAQVYQGFLDAACMDIVSGAFDYNSVLRRVVTQLTNSGLRQIDYVSGRSNRIDVAARRAIMTGMSQITGKITDYNAEKLGVDHFEVAWHSGARPTHAVWQGKVWTREQLINVCGLGSATGLLGINCYHEYYPFFPGISERNWTDEWLEEKKRQENTPKIFGGKEYTLYEAKQQQRKMETAMRAQREKVKLLEAGGADPDEVMLARAKYQGQLDEYARFSKKMGLPQERERIYLDMRGRIATKVAKSSSGQKRRTTLGANRNDSLISEEERIRNELLSRKYDQLSLEEFKKMHHTISKEERKILYGRSHFSGYINSSNARKLNKLLREGSDLPKDYQEISNTLSEVIKKNSVQKDIVVTRYVSRDALESIAGIAFPKGPGLLSGKEGVERYWTDIEKLKENIKVGHTYVEKGFLSTSGVSDKNVMSDKAIQLMIKVPKGTNAYITTNDRESEIIFGIGTKLEIVNVNVENNKTTDLKIVLDCLMR